MKTMSQRAFTLVEIMIVVAFIALLCSLAIPAVMKSRLAARKSACINNLRMIDGAKEQATMEYGLNEGGTVLPAHIDGYLKGGVDSVKCPADATKSFATSYNINVVGTNPACQNVPLEHKLEN